MKYNTKWVLFLVTILGIVHVQAEHVHKTVLSNGLTVLVRKTNTLQKVSTQLWIRAGSKHERDDERGLAHWLEHMIFKGTTTMTEQDFDLATKKLSGNINAATSYDWTHFFIDLPLQHWYEALPIFADCLQNCTFKEDLLNAEIQIVIQELKMYKDHFSRALLSHTMSSIFHDHPYHYPIIGYKNDLKKLTRTALLRFYKKYYVPSNAVLVIVGNINVQKAIELVEKYFGSIPPKRKPIESTVIHQDDICSQSTTIYRTIQQPIVTLSYVIPGLKMSEPYIPHILMLILSNMQNSSLKQLLIDNHQLVNWINCYNLELFDYDLFRISFEPKQYDDVHKIIMLIQQEIDAIVEQGISDEKLAAAMKHVETSYYSFLESNHDQASEIAKAYLAYQDENFVFERYIMKDLEIIKTKVQEFAARYLRASVRHKGSVLPLPKNEQHTWKNIQEISNNEDAEILKDKQRNTELEPPQYSVTIEPQKPIDTLIPQPEVLKLENGLTVYYYHNPSIPKINLILKLKANNFYQENHQRGIFPILSDMLQEGTRRFSKEKLDKEFSNHGIKIDIVPGLISADLLMQDFPKAFELLEEIVVRPTFNNSELTKIKSLLLADIKRSWDDANIITQTLVDEYFYDGHPFSKKSSIKKSLLNITQKTLFTFHQKYFTPQEAALIIVGNLKDYNIPDFIHQTIAHWRGPQVPDIEWPEVIPNTQRPTSYHLEREQVVLTLASLSVARTHPDFYKLLLFDAVLHEKLFSLRSRSGAFYTISGSLLHGAGKQPGLVYITANVSQTRLQEAENMIREALPSFIASFNENDLQNAKLKLLNAPADLYSTNASIAEIFNFLHYQELPFDYFVQRNKIIEKISVEDVKEAVSKLVNPEKLVAFKVGRITDEKD